MAPQAVPSSAPITAEHSPDHQANTTTTTQERPGRNGHSGRLDSGIRLDGKVALVTGSSRGIGRGIALDLASRGADVAIHYVASRKGAEAVVEQARAMGVRAVAVQGDLAVVAEVASMVESAVAGLGKLDVVVSNAGRECFESLEDTTQELYDSVMDLNTRGQFFVAQQGYRHMNEGGRVILMSSVAAHMRGLAGHALYAASKAAIEAIVRSLPSDFAPKRVTCNAIAPGGVASDMAEQNAWRYTPGGTPDMSLDKIYAGLAAICPLGRFGVPEDIAKTVAFLASDESEWVNGQTIGLTGGSKT